MNTGANQVIAARTCVRAREMDIFFKVRGLLIEHRIKIESAGDVTKDEITQKEIGSWISQSTEGQILETDLPWLTVPEKLIIAGGGRF